MAIRPDDEGLKRFLEDWKDRRPQVGDPQTATDIRRSAAPEQPQPPSRPPVGPAPITPNSRPAPSLPPVRSPR